MAFSRDLAAGYDEIEADAWLTADGRAVIYHDATISRRRCRGRYGGRDVWRLTAREIAGIRCHGQPIPTEAQLIDLLTDSRDRDVILRLETKSFPGQRPASVKSWAWRVAEPIVRSGLLGRAVLEAFNWTSFAGYRQASARLRVSALATIPTAAAIAEAHRLGAYDLSYPAQFAAPAVNDSITDNHLVPTVWNVDPVTPAPRAPSPALRRMVLAVFRRLSCDGTRVIITNYPQLFVQARAALTRCTR